MFKKSQMVLTAADHVLIPLGEKMPEGVVLGARGAYGMLAPKSALNDWWWNLYQNRWKAYPVQAPYRMAQGLMGLKLAVEKAMAANRGKKPSTEQIAAALTGLEWESPGGRIKMALGGGHQAVQPTAIGVTKWDAEKRLIVMKDIQRFAAECVNPPPTMKSEDWIKAGFPGAKCK
jgi:branched-chain amino acid transport system substrate-binding protein